MTRRQALAGWRWPVSKRRQATETPPAGDTGRQVAAAAPAGGGALPATAVRG